MRMSIISAALVLAACGQQPVVNSEDARSAADLHAANTTELAPREKIAPNVAEHVREQLRKEPKINDFVFDPDRAVMLQVAVKNDGGRQWGYAEYLCMSLKDWGVDTREAAVRVVDASKVAASNGDFRSISLGAVQCRDGSRLD